ncbi:unnamed protein product [Protopolystoma xenopodis]|uniref:Uncharacterized protein n=1 Tax=Protopolystoma xenopodis TaxID=117903 RepID=A0A448XDF7_9PLAT|nr:unnamed protein product [Protopolystoma xenopodis]
MGVSGLIIGPGCVEMTSLGFESHSAEVHGPRLPFRLRLAFITIPNWNRTRDAFEDLCSSVHLTTLLVHFSATFCGLE